MMPQDIEINCICLIRGLFTRCVYKTLSTVCMSLLTNVL